MHASRLATSIHTWGCACRYPRRASNRRPGPRCFPRSSRRPRRPTSLSTGYSAGRISRLTWWPRGPSGSPGRHSRWGLCFTALTCRALPPAADAEDGGGDDAAAVPRLHSVVQRCAPALQEACQPWSAADLMLGCEQALQAHLPSQSLRAKSLAQLQAHLVAQEDLQQAQASLQVGTQPPVLQPPACLARCGSGQQDKQAGTSSSSSSPNASGASRHPRRPPDRRPGAWRISRRSRWPGRPSRLSTGLSPRRVSRLTWWPRRASSSAGGHSRSVHSCLPSLASSAVHQLSKAGIASCCQAGGVLHLPAQELCAVRGQHTAAQTPLCASRDCRSASHQRPGPGCFSRRSRWPGRPSSLSTGYGVGRISRLTWWPRRPSGSPGRHSRWAHSCLLPVGAAADSLP